MRRARELRVVPGFLNVLQVWNRKYAHFRLAYKKRRLCKIDTRDTF